MYSVLLIIKLLRSCQQRVLMRNLILIKWETLTENLLIICSIKRFKKKKKKGK